MIRLDRTKLELKASFALKSIGYNTIRLVRFGQIESLKLKINQKNSISFGKIFLTESNSKFDLIHFQKN